MGLSKKHAIAKELGFKKGVLFFGVMQVLTIFWAMNILSIFTTQTEYYMQYGIQLPGSYMFVIGIEKILIALSIYGLWKISSNGYYFIIVRFVASPIILVICYAILESSYPGFLFMDTAISNVLASVLVSIIFIVYIRNRKILFAIESDSFKIDCQFFANAYKNNCKTLKEISSIYMIDKKTLQYNLDKLAEQYGKCLQYEDYFIFFSPYKIMTKEEFNEQAKQS